MLPNTTAPPPELGLYVHLPFCPARCPYCDFYSEQFRAGRYRRLMPALRRHLARVAPGAGGRRLASVYLGGGTPSMLPARELAGLLSAVRDSIGLLPGAEVTLEANPGTLSPAKLSRLAAAGVNRLSLGVQSLDRETLCLLGRRQPAGAAARALAWSREAGMTSVSLDLIYGLPGQDRTAARKDLEAALALAPDHLSLYELTLAPGTEFGRRYQKGRLPLPNDDTLAAMERDARGLLAAAGYRRYEVSNFARPGHHCRHNLSTWRGGDYLALGPGAHGHLAGLRFAWVADAAEYARALAAGREPYALRERLSGRDRARELLMLGLRTTEGADLARAAALWGADAPACWRPALAELAERGWATTRGDCLVPSPAGLDMADAAAALFF